MAYSSSITLKRGSSAGHLIVEISESDVAASSEMSFDLGSRWWRLLRQTCTHVSGDASTVDPILGTATSPGGISTVVENGTAGATVDNAPTGGVPFCTATAADEDNTTVYHRSVPDSGTNNVITTRYIFQKEGE